MSFYKYFKEHLFHIIIILLLVGFSRAALVVFKAHHYIQVAIPLCMLAVFAILFLLEFFKKRTFYNSIFDNLEHIDKKYLIQELISRNTFLEGRLLKDILDKANKAMIEEVSKYRLETKEYKEYIEMWVHEIKTPIATTKMIIENHPSEETKSIEEEMKKIDSYVEQVLYYSRSNHVEKDYMIRKVELEQMVHNVLFLNKKDIMSKKIKIELKDIKKEIYSDPKWIEFIINQLLINSIKYNQKENPKIEIYTKEGSNNVSLFIKDNGIGMDPKDQAKLFQKGFTGSNGRLYKKATGMGIYLCKKLCDKLGHDLIIESKKDKGTTVKIVFPYDKKIEEIR